jgi:hypothetical protein
MDETTGRRPHRAPISGICRWARGAPRGPKLHKLWPMSSRSDPFPRERPALPQVYAHGRPSSRRAVALPHCESVLNRTSCMVQPTGETCDVAVFCMTTRDLLERVERYEPTPPVAALRYQYYSCASLQAHVGADRASPCRACMGTPVCRRRTNILTWNSTRSIVCAWESPR